MIIQAPRNPAPEGKQWFNVETTFIRKGYFDVVAENAEEAKKLVEEECFIEPSKISTRIPLDQIEWDFPLIFDMELGDVKEVPEGD